MCVYIRRNRWIQALFILLVLPLFPESLRNQNKTYFDSMNWEELNDLAIPPLPEAYTIQESQPVPYADTIDDDRILPSLPQLGILDYQNIPEDVLGFCDSLSDAFSVRSIPEDSFSKQRPFLPHFGHFIIERLPALSHIFYGRPTFKQDGSAQILFRLSVRPQDAKSEIVESAETPLVSESAAESPQEIQSQNTKEQKEVSTEADGETKAQQAAAELLPAEIAVGSTSSTAEQAVKASQQHEADIPALFSELDVPEFIMLEVTAVKEDGRWKISGIDIKGAEYADSALKN